MVKTFMQLFATPKPPIKERSKTNKLKINLTPPIGRAIFGYGKGANRQTVHLSFWILKRATYDLGEWRSLF